MARKKIGRNKEFCKRYKAEGRKEKNKVAKLVKTLKTQPTNFVAIKALSELAPNKADEFAKRAKELKQ